MRDILALALIRAELCRAEMDARRKHAAPLQHAGKRGAMARMVRLLRRMRGGPFIPDDGTRRRGTVVIGVPSPPD